MPVLSAAYTSNCRGKLQEVAGGTWINACIQPVSRADLQGITRRTGWVFNWKAEWAETDGRELFKLVTTEAPDMIQCLLGCRKAQGYYFITLVETAPRNHGRSKQYYGAPANMVAYVCRLSFAAGFEGVVAFTPKSNLVQHYKRSLGAVLINKFDMAIYTAEARHLINVYYDEET